VSRHLLDIAGLDDAALDHLLARAVALAAGAPVAARRGTVANLFFEPSTRTRVSFTMAARRLGLDVVDIDHSGSSASKGESLLDTVQTLAAMGIATIVLRHPDNGAAAELAEALGPAGPALINAGDGCHAHPSQALLDAATLIARGIAIQGLRVAVIGDVRHSRVARSDLALLARRGAAELRVAGPPEFLPDPDWQPGIRRCSGLDEAVDGIDVVICLRIQRERIGASGYPDGAAYQRRWGLDARRIARLPSHVRILHPGPVNRGVELTAEALASPQSLVLDQVAQGVHTRTAIFEWLVDAPGAEAASASR